MYREEIRSSERSPAAGVTCTAELAKTGAGVLIATATTPEWARAQIEHERSGVFAVSG